jgi:hypothetical protein
VQRLDIGLERAVSFGRPLSDEVLIEVFGSYDNSGSGAHVGGSSCVAANVGRHDEEEGISEDKFH